MYNGTAIATKLIAYFEEHSDCEVAEDVTTLCELYIADEHIITALNRGIFDAIQILGNSGGYVNEK